MIYKLHYWFFASGANVFSILIGVFVETYTDASPSELGTLLMVIPFFSIIFRPIICSVADRKQAHRKYLLVCLIVVAISYMPFAIIPFLGESIYRTYARTCWYIFMLLKLIGDVAFGGVISIGDSLAINYAKRIGTSFTVYRVWGTISWMFFGIVIGQINEIEYLPKYVPGFIVLIAASVLDCFCIWLWPKEYFEMMSATNEDNSGVKQQDNNDAQTNNTTTQEKVEKEDKKKENVFTKSLMPKEVVWAQAKQKLLRIVCCCCCSKKESNNQLASKKTEMAIVDKVELAKRERIKEIEKLKEESREINKTTQLRILLVLFRRDPRIILYLVYFTFSGATMATLSFFYINLSDICHNRGACDFSQLAGLMQVTMSSLETLVFIYIARIMAKTGRVNMAALAMLFVAIKFTFYGTVWTHLSPYYSLLVEGFHGLIFGIQLTLMVETGHLFSGEVQYIIPELLECGIISVETDTTRLKYSLAATMQAIISSAFDGFGRGLGALTFGLFLERYSYEALWLLIGIMGLILFLVILAINMIGTLLGLKLGLDVKAKIIDDELAEKKRVDLESAVITSSPMIIAPIDPCQIHPCAELSLSNQTNALNDNS